MSSIEQHRMILKEAGLEIFNLCELQLNNTKEAFFSQDHDMAEEVIYLEKRINAMGHKIDRECERFLILHHLKSHDLKFVLGIRRINFGLQRIGNYCINMSKYISEMRELPNKKILSKMEMDEMFSIAISMLQDIIESYKEGDSKKLKKISAKQQMVEETFRRFFEVVSVEVKKDFRLVDEYLLQFTLIMKLEVIGSLLTKIAEEVIFNCEAEIWREQEVKFEWD